MVNYCRSARDDLIYRQRFLQPTRVDKRRSKQPINAHVKKVAEDRHSSRPSANNRAVHHACRDGHSGRTRRVRRFGSGGQRHVITRQVLRGARRAGGDQRDHGRYSCRSKGYFYRHPRASEHIDKETSGMVPCKNEDCVEGGFMALRRAQRSFHRDSHLLQFGSSDYR